MVYLADIAENRKDLELPGEAEHQKAQGLQSSQISGTRTIKEAIRIAIVGPEGGFDDEERRIWTELQRDFVDQFKTIQISNNVLRTETAAIAMLAYLSSSLVGNRSK